MAEEYLILMNSVQNQLLTVIYIFFYITVLICRRQKLIYELNSSGKYFAFKEQLKHAVVKIVREKYLRTSTFEDRQELQVMILA